MILAAFSWGIVWDSFRPLLRGARITVELTVLTMVLAVVLGVILALLRLSPSRAVRTVTTGWVELWRATPLLLQIYWIFYVMPATFHLTLSPFVTGLVGLTANVSAFLSETFRAGIISIRPGQRQAALALGMTPRQAFVRAIAPQAASRVLPAVASTWVSLFKDTSLVSTIAVSDISYRALQLRTQNYRTLEVLTALALMYLALGYPQAKLADWIHRRFEVHE